MTGGSAPTPAAPPASAPASFAADARRIAALAWPVYIGQVAVLAFSTIDTALLARHSTTDLAALAVGASAYITVFIGLMGVVLALGPIVGRHFGARELPAAGAQVHQALWIALVLAALGSTLLCFPLPFLRLAGAGDEVQAKVRGYLFVLAFSLPASLLFTVYRGFNNAISRPKAVMTLQLAGLALKLPLSAALIFGVPALGVPSLGAVGAALATCLVMWSQAIAAFTILRRDRTYAPFRLWGRGLDRPDRAAIRAQLKLGIPMGLTILVDVSGFAFMAIFIARLGTTPVAGHQIVANLVSLLFMLPLAIASATGTLVAQRIGARDEPHALLLGWHGMAVVALLAGAVGATTYLLRESILGLYTADAAVIAVTLPLVAWVAVFHLADALQAVASAVLRAWHVATMPLVIYAVAIWGVGLAGGYALAFDVPGGVPASMQGPRGFWLASTSALCIVAVALIALLAWIARLRRRERERELQRERGPERADPA
jgi:MATE family multidrug resistance protein